MDAFAPPVDSWQQLSPRYLTMKRMMVLVVWGVEFLVAAIAVGILWRWWAAGMVVVLGLCWIAYRWWRQGRVYRMWGFAERDTDLYLREGLLFRRLTVVPYGRMQLVEVESGPISRHYGLSSVKMVTASAHTDAEVPGLERAQAEALRERLTALGEQQAVGL